MQNLKEKNDTIGERKKWTGWVLGKMQRKYILKPYLKCDQEYGDRLVKTEQNEMHNIKQL